MKVVLQNTNINIRLPKKLKDKFIEITKQKGLSYSMVIRNMIKNYISQNGEGKEFDSLNGMGME